MPFIADDQPQTAESGFVTDKPKKGLLEKIGDFIAPATTSIAKITGKAPALGTEAMERNKRVEDLGKESRELIKKAGNLPRGSEEQKDLLDQSRAIDRQIESEGAAQRGEVSRFKEDVSITDKDIEDHPLKFAFGRGAEASAELTAFLLPSTTGFKALGAGSTAIQRIAQAGKVGAATGALTGASRIDVDGFGEKLKTTALGGLGGFALGTVLTAGFEGAKAAPKAFKQIGNNVKKKIGRQQLNSFLKATPTVQEKADDLGIDIAEELIRNDQVEGGFAKVKNVREFTDEFGTTMSEKFKYAGQEKSDDIIRQQEKVIKNIIKKKGTKIVVGKNQVLNGLDDFVTGNTLTAPEKESAMKFLTAAVDEQFGSRGTIDAGEALELKRFLFSKAGKITDRASVKRKGLERMAQIVNGAFKGRVSDGVDDALRQQQVQIFLRDEVIGQTGRKLYSEAAKSIAGLSPSEIRTIGSQMFQRTLAGGVVGGPAGGLVGAATTVPELASKVIGPEKIAGRFLKPAAEQATQQVPSFLRNLGLIGQEGVRRGSGIVSGRSVGK